MRALLWALAALAAWAAGAAAYSLGANLLTNAGFETNDGGALAANWTVFPADARFYVSTLNKRSGAASVFCNSSSTAINAAVQQIDLATADATSVFAVRGWSQASSVGTGLARNYSVFLDVEFVDGSFSFGNIAAFSAGTHAFELAQLVFCPTKPIRNLRVHAYLAYRTGDAYFDDFGAHIVTQALSSASSSWSVIGGASDATFAVARVNASASFQITLIDTDGSGYLCSENGNYSLVPLVNNSVAQALSYSVISLGSGVFYLNVRSSVAGNVTFDVAVSGSRVLTNLTAVFVDIDAAMTTITYSANVTGRLGVLTVDLRDALGRSYNYSTESYAMQLASGDPGLTLVSYNLTKSTSTPSRVVMHYTLSQIGAAAIRVIIGNITLNSGSPLNVTHFPPFPIISSFVASDPYERTLGYGVDDVFTISFDQSTNRPDLSSNASLFAMFRFSETPGSAFVCTWSSDGTALSIAVSATGDASPRLASARVTVIGDLRNAAGTSLPGRSVSPALTGTWGELVCGTYGLWGPICWHWWIVFMVLAVVAAVSIGVGVGKWRTRTAYGRTLRRYENEMRDKQLGAVMKRNVIPMMHSVEDLRAAAEGKAPRRRGCCGSAARVARAAELEAARKRRERTAALREREARLAMRMNSVASVNSDGSEAPAPETPDVLASASSSAADVSVGVHAQPAAGPEQPQLLGADSGEVQLELRLPAVAGDGDLSGLPPADALPPRSAQAKAARGSRSISPLPEALNFTTSDTLSVPVREPTTSVSPGEHIFFSSPSTQRLPPPPPPPQPTKRLSRNLSATPAAAASLDPIAYLAVSEAGSKRAASFDAGMLSPTASAAASAAYAFAGIEPSLDDVMLGEGALDMPTGAFADDGRAHADLVPLPVFTTDGELQVPTSEVDFDITFGDSARGSMPGFQVHSPGQFLAASNLSATIDMRRSPAALLAPVAGAGGGDAPMDWLVMPEAAASLAPSDYDVAQSLTSWPPPPPPPASTASVDDADRPASPASTSSSGTESGDERANGLGRSNSGDLARSLRHDELAAAISLSAARRPQSQRVESLRVDARPTSSPGAISAHATSPAPLPRTGSLHMRDASPATPKDLPRAGSLRENSTPVAKAMSRESLRSSSSSVRTASSPSVSPLASPTHAPSTMSSSARKAPKADTLGTPPSAAKPPSARSASRDTPPTSARSASRDAPTPPPPPSSSSKPSRSRAPAAAATSPAATATGASPARTPARTPAAERASRPPKSGASSEKLPRRLDAVVADAEAWALSDSAPRRSAVDALNLGRKDSLESFDSPAGPGPRRSSLLVISDGDGGDGGDGGGEPPGTDA